ncbi:BRCA2-interacting transcriptional repressor EMSY-like [Anneissia japonica]|uniref:BRCA2-interacting transcriptional repressor EMSY-like n=1 Tax=Anneissia japonica TaxID=1529436 RepID=UPI001425A5A0|nr:BRCA2-interacting transcriptional repressor EMSY-like [Anneissia japonica]XP_033118254.1 BRCA2-interacting transcriptional repressor EMSY-like [Anneissia japonica]
MVTVWPLILDMSRDDCKRLLRRLELEAYASMVSALRAQGTLTKEKKKLLADVASVLSISTERHRAEVRRAVNDEKLTTVAERLSGSNNSVEWSIEGRRLVPLLPRLVPQTAFTEVANEAAEKAFTKNLTMPVPADACCKEGAHEVIVAISKSSRLGTSSPMVLPPLTVLPSGLSVPVKGGFEPEDNGSESSLKRKRSNSLSSVTSASNEVTTAVSIVTANVKPTVVSHKGTLSYLTSTGASDGSLKIPITKAVASVAPPQPHIGKQKVIIVSSSNSPITSTILERSQCLTTSRYSPVSSGQKTPDMFTSAQFKSNVAATVVSTAITQSVTMTSVAQQLNKSMATTVVNKSMSTTVVNKSMATTVVSPASSRVLTSAVMSASSALLSRQKVFGKTKMSKGLVQSPLPVTLQNKLLPGQKPTIKIKQDSGVKIITQTIGTSGSKVITKPLARGSTSGTSVVMVTCVPASLTSKPITTISGSSGQVLISSVGGARIVTTSPQFAKSAAQIGNIITVTPKSLQQVVGSKSGASSVIMSKPYSSTSSTITKPNVIVVQKGQAAKGLSIHRTIPVSSEVQRQTVGHDVSSSVISRPRISMIPSSSSITSPNIITSTIRFPSPQYSKSQVIHKGSMLELMGALKGNKEGKIKTQVIIRPKSSRSIQDGKESVILQDRVLTSEVEKLLSVKRTVSVSPSTVSIKSAGAAVADDGASFQSRKSADGSSTVLISGNQPNKEWIEYDATATNQSASSAIKALLEFRSKPGEAGDAPRRSQTIDLSKMAKVPMVTKKALDSGPLKLQLVSQGKATKTITITPQQLSAIESEQAASIIKDIAFQTERSSPVDTTAQKQLHEEVVTPQAIKVTPTQMSFVDQFEEFLEKEGLSGVVDDTIQESVSSGRDLLQTAAELTLLKEDILACDLLPEGTPVAASVPSTSKTSESTPESFGTIEKEVDPYEFDSREDSPVDAYIGKIPSGKVPIGLEHDRTPSSTQIQESTLTSTSPSVCSESPTCKTSPVDKPWDVESNLNTQSNLHVLSFTSLHQDPRDANKAGATPVMVEKSGLDLSHMQMTDFASQRLEESLEQDEVMTDSTTSVTGQSQEEGLFSSQSSSSDTSCLADSPGSVRASKRKRKAPIAIDEDASPSQLPSWTRAALNLLQRVSRFRGSNRGKGDPNAASWFTRPVSAIEAPNYHKIVSNPMDFGTIKRKLESQAYDDFIGFHNDMLQVRINCSLYNPPEHQVRLDCEEVFQFYLAEYAKVIERWQKMQLTAPKSPKRFRPDSHPKSPSRILEF